MDLDEVTLNNYSKYIDFFDIDSSIYEFEDNIELAMIRICEHLNLDLNYEIGTFGAIRTNNYISQIEPLTFYVNVANYEIYENTMQLKNVRNVNKKAKTISIESIKFLIALYLDKFLTDECEVLVSNTSIDIKAVSLFGFNISIFVMASKINENVILDSYSGKISELDYYLYEKLISDKNVNTSGNFGTVVNIVKNLSSKLGLLRKSFLIESLLYNVPDRYFKGDLRAQVIKSINYINYINLSKCKSIISKDKLLAEDNLTVYSIYELYKEYEKFMNAMR